MNLDHLFEDLEAQFESGFGATVAHSKFLSCNGLRIVPQRGLPENLVAPIIGSDFVAGLDQGFMLWHVFPSEQIIEILPQTYEDSELPRLKHFDRKLCDLLESFAKPVEIVWHTGEMHNAPQRGMMVELVCGLMVVETTRGIVAVSPRSASKICIEVVDNLSEEFEVRVG